MVSPLHRKPVKLQAGHYHTFFQSKHKKRSSHRCENSVIKADSVSLLQEYAASTSTDLTHHGTKTKDFKCQLFCHYLLHMSVMNVKKVSIYELQQFIVEHLNIWSSKSHHKWGSKSWHMKTCTVRGGKLDLMRTQSDESLWLNGNV